MPASRVTVELELKNAEDVQRLASAIALLHQYAAMNGDTEVLGFCSEAAESLQNLGVSKEVPRNFLR